MEKHVFPGTSYLRQGLSSLTHYRHCHRSCSVTHLLLGPRVLTGTRYADDAQIHLVAFPILPTPGPRPKLQAQAPRHSPQILPDPGARPSRHYTCRATFVSRKVAAWDASERFPILAGWCFFHREPILQIVLLFLLFVRSIAQFASGSHHHHPIRAGDVHHPTRASVQFARPWPSNPFRPLSNSRGGAGSPCAPPHPPPLQN